MQNRDKYQHSLEVLIVKDLLPVWEKYFRLSGDPKPELDPLLISTIKKKIPQLFKPKQ
jgi:hypothetical protein